MPYSHLCWGADRTERRLKSISCFLWFSWQKTPGKSSCRSTFRVWLPSWHFAGRRLRTAYVALEPAGRGVIESIHNPVWTTQVGARPTTAMTIHGCCGWKRLSSQITGPSGTTMKCSRKVLASSSHWAGLSLPPMLQWQESSLSLLLYPGAQHTHSCLPKIIYTISAPGEGYSWEKTVQGVGG